VEFSIIEREGACLRHSSSSPSLSERNIATATACVSAKLGASHEEATQGHEAEAKAHEAEVDAEIVTILKAKGHKDFQAEEGEALAA
jgi:hypothetical protein